LSTLTISRCENTGVSQLKRSSSAPSPQPPPTNQQHHTHKTTQHHPETANHHQKFRRLTSLSILSNRKFSGDESFLKDPNAFNDAKNTAALQVVDEPVEPAADDKSRL
jgi:hypothetical protein